VLGADYADVDRNDPPDFAAARRSGLRFVYRRVTWGTYVDSQWMRDLRSTARAGIVDGGYAFLRYDDHRKTPELQMDTFHAALFPTPRMLPPALDFECDREHVGMTADEIIDWSMRAWRRCVQLFGTKPVVYTSTRWLIEECQGQPWPDEIADSAWWVTKPWRQRTHTQAQIANYEKLEPALDYGGFHTPWKNPWFVYQYQGDSIGFPGFSRAVDVNRFRVTRQGHVGDHVRFLERRLGRKETGVFDDELGEMVRDIQLRNSLDPDRVVGAATFGPICWSDARCR
jgi:hypothetical protein